MTIEYFHRGSGRISVIAIDPGPEHSGVVAWNGSVRLTGVIGNGMILESMQQWINEFSVDIVAVEQLCNQGRSVGQSTFDTAIWAGRFVEKAVQCHCDFQLVTRRQIKAWHCNKSIGVNDAMIRAKLIEKYGEPGTKKKPGRTYGVTSHAWQALALATFLTEGGISEISRNEVTSCKKKTQKPRRK